jgi:hypothetical protein
MKDDYTLRGSPRRLQQLQRRTDPGEVSHAGKQLQQTMCTEQNNYDQNGVFNRTVPTDKVYGKERNTPKMVFNLKHSQDA